MRSVNPYLFLQQTLLLLNNSQSGSRTRALRLKATNHNSIYQQALLLSKIFPSPGVEPGLCGWKSQILTTRPTGSFYVAIPNSDPLSDHLFCSIGNDFRVIKDLAGLQSFWQSESWTRALRLRATNPSHWDCAHCNSQDWCSCWSLAVMRRDPFQISNRLCWNTIFPQSRNLTRNLRLRSVNPSLFHQQTLLLS